MQRLKSLLLLFVLPIFVLFPQEKTKTHEFVDLLISSRLFEAFEYYDKYKDEINAEDSIQGKTFYSAFKNAALNDYDASIPYFNEIFENISDDSKFSILEVLLNFSYNSQKYEDTAYLSGKLVEILENSESPVPDEYKSNQITFYTQLKDLYSILQYEDELRVCFRDSSMTVVDFDQSYDVPIIQAQVNRHQIRSLFDTGISPPLLMTRQMSDSIGVRTVYDEFIMPFNNIPTPVSYGMLDSLTVGNLTAYNLLTLILDMDRTDQINSIDVSAFNHGDIGIMIGLPFIKQMGAVTLDFEDEKLILSVKEPVEKNNYNMLLYRNDLYLRAAISGITHTGFIDTGSSRDEITINNKLYNNYKNKFGAIKTHYTDTATLITHKDIQSLGILENLEWSLSDQSPVVDVSERSRVRLDANNQSDHYDAFYGFKFLQRFKKVVFDFDRMEFRYYYDPLREKDSWNMN